MVFSSKFPSNFRERSTGQLSTEVHPHLSGLRNDFGVVLRFELRDFEIEILCDRSLNLRLSAGGDMLTKCPSTNVLELRSSLDHFGRSMVHR